MEQYASDTGDLKLRLDLEGNGGLEISTNDGDWSYFIEDVYALKQLIKGLQSAVEPWESYEEDKEYDTEDDTEDYEYGPIRYDNDDEEDDYSLSLSKRDDSDTNEQDDESKPPYEHSGFGD